MEVENDSKMMLYIGGSGGAPAPPHPPRLLGLRPRGAGRPGLKFLTYDTFWV